MPSMCGQSEPKITRSAPMCSTTSLHVVFPERVDPHVALERLDRVLAEVAGHLVVGRAQLVEEVAQELGAVLDRRDAHVREALEQLVEHERDQEVVRGALDVERLHDGAQRPPPLKPAANPSTRVAVARVAAVARVRDDRDARPRCTRAQNGSLRGSLTGIWPVGGVRRGRAHHDRARAVVDRPLELADRPVEVGERDVRRRRRSGPGSRSPSRRRASG